ncbi:hypothetical protein P4O66_002883 [Electrophorus voltai]|uniref:Uncharacterized protein n=1 Tax=Electrophorus voltai TaxID=2609070 RepID=A0AAD8YWM6_9TELE|nr:hypothetical protein P4O66_002883 [Electrophorus voltai]
MFSLSLFTSITFFSPTFLPKHVVRVSSDAAEFQTDEVRPPSSPLSPSPKCLSLHIERLETPSGPGDVTTTLPPGSGHARRCNDTEKGYCVNDGECYFIHGINQLSCNLRDMSSPRMLLISGVRQPLSPFPVPSKLGLIHASELKTRHRRHVGLQFWVTEMSDLHKLWLKFSTKSSSLRPPPPPPPCAMAPRTRDDPARPAAHRCPAGPGEAGLVPLHPAASQGRRPRLLLSIVSAEQLRVCLVFVTCPRTSSRARTEGLVSTHEHAPREGRGTVSGTEASSASAERRPEDRRREEEAQTISGCPRGYFGPRCLQPEPLRLHMPKPNESMSTQRTGVPPSPPPPSLSWAWPGSGPAQDPPSRRRRGADGGTPPVSVVLLF